MVNKHVLIALVSLSSVLLVPSSSGQEDREKRYLNPSEHPENVYFGDAHLHTSLSLDAAAWGCSLLPEDSYRYARGEEVTSFKGWKTKLSRPLDWLVVSDHSDGYGFTNRVAAGDPWIVKEELGRRWHEMLQKGTEAERRIVADEIIKGFGGGRRHALEVG